MNKRASAPARLVAVIALICGFLVVVAIVVSSLEDNGGDSDNRSGQAGRVADDDKREAPVPKAYVVQSGDTLTSIAREVGVPVAQIVALNPGVDPQILVSGEKLKLR